MFANFLRGPDAKTVSLETIGLIAGTKEFGSTGTLVQWGQRSANKAAKRIAKVLKRDGDVLEPELRQFLTKAQRGLSKLGETRDSIGTGKYQLAGRAAVEIYQESPEWKPAVTAFQQAMLPEATQTFNRLFKEGAYATQYLVASATLDELGKRDPAVALAQKLLPRK
jgi:hypothetical protein